MKITTRLATAVVALAFTVGSAAAATYKVYSHYEGGSPEHSAWFSGGSNPYGSTGPENNHFTFENGSGHGLFVDDGATARMTGTVANAAGDAYHVEMNFVAAGDPGSYKNPFGADTNMWTFWDLDDTKTNMMKVVSSVSGNLEDLYISLRGSPLLVQMGIGANDKDADLFGLSTWTYFKTAGCATGGDCKTYHGDFNVVLSEVPLPAGVLLLPLGLGALVVARRRRTA